MNRLHRTVGILNIDQYRDLDLAGRDHMDINTLIRQRLEHHRGDTRVVRHTCADRRDLRNVLTVEHLFRAQIVRDRLDHLECGL